MSKEGLPKRRRDGRRRLDVALAALAVTAVACGGENEPPLPPPPAEVAVTMHEYRYEHQRQLPRGRVVFRVQNRGRQRHEIVLVRLPKGFPPIDKQLRSKRRRPLNTLAYLHRLAPGTTDAFAAELRPGRYAMIDFVHGAGGLPNAVRGMSSEFRVH